MSPMNVFLGQPLSQTRGRLKLICEDEFEVQYDHIWPLVEG